jgi:hypothetical protein
MSDELKPQSIGDDPEFRKLLTDLVRRASHNISGKASPAALIAHIDAWRVPAGWKLAPIQSTAEMNCAGRSVLRDCGNDQATDDDAELCWSAMIDAAPEATCGS